MPRIVYSPNYNIKLFGLEKIQPFDSRKYGRAWRLLQQKFASELQRIHVSPQREANVRELRRVHTRDYLTNLKRSRFIAKSHGVPQLSKLPAWAIDRSILRPMRWATRGTILAAEHAIASGLAINLGGGYHHAAPDRGEGFSIYADVGIATASLRRSGFLSKASRVIYVDTDAHFGNGVCRTFMHDERVSIFDVFNSHISPADRVAKQRVDCRVAVNRSFTDDDYLQELKCKLPEFLDSVPVSEIGIAFYNAGTDVLATDPLGFMNISAEAILQRDLFVVDELRQRGIPTAMVLGGGYTRQSYQLVANSVIELLLAESRMKKSSVVKRTPKVSSV